MSNPSPEVRAAAGRVLNDPASTPDQLAVAGFTLEAARDYDSHLAAEYIFPRPGPSLVDVLRIAAPNALAAEPPQNLSQILSGAAGGAHRYYNR